MERARLQTAEKAILQNGSLVTVPSKEENMGEKLVLDMENGASIAAHLASAGTLLVVGILAAVFTSDSPCVLLLDDLDHGLHPKAQKELIAVLRRLLAQRPDLQILATSHSPYLVDSFTPEEIRLTTLREDGSVACAPMKDHPSFLKWKDAMSPEELTAKHSNEDKRSAKRVHAELLLGDRECEEACWRSTALDTLKQHGTNTGLADYLAEIRQHLVPLFKPIRR